MSRAQLQGSARGFRVAARLKPGVTMRQAQAEMDSIAAQVAKDFPKSNQGWGVRVQSMHEALYGQFREPFLILEGVVAFVLLIACANVAALLLARAASRRKELALRTAIGAGRGRMIRQLLTESVLLAMTGGVAGVFVAWAGLRLLMPISPSWFPRVRVLTMNPRVLLFTTLVSMLTGLIFGVVPALRVSQPDLIEALKESSRNALDGSPRHRLRGVLVVAQIALALILLIGSGLLINSFLRLRANDLGADPRGLLTFQFRLPAARYQKPAGSYHGYPLMEVSPEPALLFAHVFEKLQHLPGAQSVAGANHTPLNGECWSRTFAIEGKQGLSEAPSAAYFMVTPNYFSTMKIPLLRGRDINAQDTVSSPWVVIVNETMARSFWPDEDPLGKRLTVDLVQDEQPREVIAVARDSRLDARQQAPLPVMYVAYNQQPPHNRGPFGGERLNMAFVLRPAAESPGDPTRLVSAVRRAVAEVDPDQAVAEIQSVERNLIQQVEEPRYWMMLLGVFAAVATLLAAAGIYGVTSYTVAQRTREIGLRMALGASGREVFRMMTRRALILVAAGVAVGLAGSFGLTRLIASWLWGVKAVDPLTFTVVTLALVAVSLLAGLLPARRAVLVDPTVALRHE
jgi:putative ABC transport system permease protein